MPEAEATVAEALAPLLGERDADGESIFPRPPGATIDTLLLGCTHYPLLRPLIAAVVGDRVAIVDSATATASALAELLIVNGLEAPGTTRGTAADAGLARSRAPDELATPATPPPAHDRRRRAASAIAGPAVRAAFPDVETIDLARGRAMTRAARARPDWRDDRVWQAGLLIGSALGAAATVVGRRVERQAREGLVDWPAVERIAIGRLARAPGRPDRRRAAGRRAGLRRGDGTDRAGARRALGTELPGRRRALRRRRSGRLGPGQHGDVRLAHRQARGRPARPGRARRWRLRQGRRWRWPTAGSRPASSASCSGSWASASSASTTSPCCRRSRRPAGCCSSRRTSARRPRALGVPLDPFRTWIALHETTHAFEFEAHPWLRPYLAARLERQLTLFGGDVRGLGREAMRGLGRALRGESDGGHWMERLMGDEQRRLFRETQAVMSLLEGFSDYVMDEVGADLVPDVERDQRPLPRAPRAADAVRAVDAPADRHGPQDGAVQEGRARSSGPSPTRAAPAALRRLWDGPETLPRDGEIDAPERWIARVLDAAARRDRRAMTDGRTGPRSRAAPRPRSP